MYVMYIVLQFTCNTSHTITSNQHSIQSVHSTSETLSDCDNMDGDEACMRQAERPVSHGGISYCRRAIEN